MSFVVDVLTGKQYLEPGPNDRSDLDPLLTMWRRGQREEALRAGFIEALTHPDPKVRAGGVMFFARMTTRPEDVDLLLPLLTDKVELYDGVREPWFGGRDDLRSMLASAIASRTPAGHPAVDVLEAEALEEGRAGWVIVALVGLDPVWVRSHAGAIVTNSPGALDPLLYNLQMRGVDLTPFLQELRQEVDDDVVRAGIRSALGARASEVEASVFGP